MSNLNLLEYSQSIFDIEFKEIMKVKEKIAKNDFLKIVSLIEKCPGKLVVTGIGKTGLIGKKIAATLSSTGTNAVFMNSTEGLHGDLGIVNSQDIVIAISNSGNSDEINAIIPSLKKIGASIVAMTGNLKSKLAKNSDYVIDIGVDNEGCPLSLAPMASTTAALVTGDALAATLMKIKKFEPQDFAVFHPGGSLGRQLLTEVKDLMHCLDEIPLVKKEASAEKIILAMTEKNLGAACVVDQERMLGIITEGDLRRALSQKEKFFSLKAFEVMNSNFISISKNLKAIEALKIMEEKSNKISVLPVLESNKLIGLIRIHDLISSVG